jgi:hypothetical protein
MHPCMRYSVYVYVSSCVHYMSLCTRIMIAGERARASEKNRSSVRENRERKR